LSNPHKVLDGLEDCVGARLVCVRMQPILAGVFEGAIMRRMVQSLSKRHCLQVPMASRRGKGNQAGLPFIDGLRYRCGPAARP